MVTRHQAVDAVIVGAGAAGSVMAARLAEGGKQVVLLEAGPPWSLSDLYSSQFWTRRLRWGGAPVDRSGDDPYWYNFSSGHGFGGAALHHYAAWPRYHEEDFRMASLYGRGFDWAIDYRDLRPYYDRVQADVGLSGDAQAEIWRPPGQPYPMPPLPLDTQNRILKRGFDRLGFHTAPLPVAINSVPYQGRPACIYDGWCDAGCPIGALGNPLVVYLPRAQRAGAELRAHAGATRILTDGQRATAVEYYDRQGQVHEQAADTIILAANPIQNPRLLLNSASARHPGGLANSSGLVGRYFMAHAMTLIFGMFEQKTECYRGVLSGQLTTRDGYVKNSRAGDAFGSYHWQAGITIKPNDLLGVAASRPDIMGEDLHAFMRRGAHHMAHMLGVVEGLPVRDNRVELTSDKDRFGFPRAHIVHTFHPGSRALWDHVRQEGVNILKAAGAQDAWHGPPVPSHFMGGTVMGSDPAASVTDGYGRTHDVSNLVIASSGTFPTSAGVGPTFTIHAFVMRTAEHMLAHWGDYSA